LRLLRHPQTHISTSGTLKLSSSWPADLPTSTEMTRPTTRCTLGGKSHSGRNSGGRRASGSTRGYFTARGGACQLDDAVQILIFCFAIVSLFISRGMRQGPHNGLLIAGYRLFIGDHFCVFLQGHETGPLPRLFVGSRSFGTSRPSTSLRFLMPRHIAGPLRGFSSGGG